uniref:Protein sprouty homolog 2 n=1 Tax=Arion vulgaris TaxID=1028688 RepID=A0A0B6ZIC6_9EUPU
MRTSLRTIPQPDTFSRQTTSVISLGQVRSGPQTTNEYVDSPRSHIPPSLKPQLASIGGGVNSPGFARRVILPSRGVGGGGGGNTGSPRSTLTSSLSSPVVTQQLLPKSPPLKKEPVNLLEGGRGGDGADTANDNASAALATKHVEGIICDKCRKCRCSACTEPRKLPSHWCCRDTCEISPNKVLDVCTCFCCVKGVFYHCGAEEDNECYEKPCGCCSTPQCCQRWTVLGMMALCLPCLWAYWPATACLAGCTGCYNRCRHKGCQCHVEQNKGTSILSEGGSTSDGCGSGGGSEENSKHSQTRRLLIESDSSSA